MTDQEKIPSPFRSSTEILGGHIDLPSYEEKAERDGHGEMHKEISEMLGVEIGGEFVSDVTGTSSSEKMVKAMYVMEAAFALYKDALESETPGDGLPEDVENHWFGGYDTANRAFWDSFQK